MRLTDRVPGENYCSAEHPDCPPGMACCEHFVGHSGIHGATVGDKWMEWEQEVDDDGPEAA